MILIYQGLENTSYQVKKQRYNENQTALPVFQEETRTDLVQAQQQNSQVTSPLSSMLSKSSFKDSYEKILERYSSQFLTEAPQGSLEWMYATGGIVSLR